ncbi:MAG TPA: hypothetical protein PK600_10435, partial [Deltaproteobacteria bacterium]|nr:hypothetical protein [Deltaproteobacteria bacterium]
PGFETMISLSSRDFPQPFSPVRMSIIDGHCLVFRSHVLENMAWKPMALQVQGSFSPVCAA